MTSEMEAFVTRVLLVSPGQWARAAERAAGRPVGVLEVLTRTRAEWSPPDDPAMAVSEYQFRQIVAHAGTLAALTDKLVWNGYLILEELGKGGMGTVFKGWDPRAGRYVALKRPIDANPETVRRLNREAKLFAKIEHDHVARLYANEQFAGLPLVVLQFVPGTDLRKLIDARVRDGTPIPWPEAARWGAELLSALAAIHAAGVVHRDVKPGNVMLREQGKSTAAVLLDMGLGKSLNEVAGADGASVGGDLTRHAMPIGTFFYMSPEQWNSGADVTGPSDVYSLGVTLYEVLAGRPPFVGTMLQLCRLHDKETPPPIRAARPDVPIAFDTLIRKMLEKVPAHRGSAAHLAGELRKLAATPAAQPPPPPRPVPPRSPAKVVEWTPDPRPLPPPARPEESVVALTPADRPAPMGLFGVAATGWRLVRARLRLWAGPPSPQVSEAAHERTTRREIRQLSQRFRSGLRDRGKSLVYPHRAPLEWLLLLGTVALLLRAFRVW